MSDEVRKILDEYLNQEMQTVQVIDIESEIRACMEEFLKSYENLK